MVEKLRKLIEERGLTQTAVETAAHLSANRISKWAGGQGEPTARQALRLAQIFGVPVAYLIDDSLDDLPEPPPPLSDDERAVLELFQALELGRKEALRRLASPVVSDAAGPPRSPAEPPAPEPTRPPHGGKRRVVAIQDFTDVDHAAEERKNRPPARKKKGNAGAGKGGEKLKG